MSPSTLELCEQLIRLAKGICTACERWLLTQKALDRQAHEKGAN